MALAPTFAMADLPLRAPELEAAATSAAASRALETISKVVEPRRLLASVREGPFFAASMLRKMDAKEAAD